MRVQCSNCGFQTIKEGSWQHPHDCEAEEARKAERKKKKQRKND